MSYIELPPGEGQEIYVDPNEIYIKPEWINHELHCIIYPDIPMHESNPVYEAYKKLFQSLYEKGYKIITDSRMAGSDTFFLTPCFDKHINNKEDYISKKKKKIAYCLSSEGLKEPFSLSFPEDSFPEILPTLPFIVKNEKSHGGTEKFIVRTKEQVATLKRFYNEINNYARQKSIEKVKQQWSGYPDLEFDELGHSNRGINIWIVDYKKIFHQDIRMQQFIKTPTEYNTSLRVLTSSSGDILASSLKYAMPSKNPSGNHTGLFSQYLSDPSSPYFLNSDSVISNTVAGGNSILLGKDHYSSLEQEILKAHDIDPNNAVVPEDVRKACIKIAMNCSREIGAICGLDFIYDEEEKAWKYLEEHEYPMLYSYAEKYHFPYDPHALDFSTTDQLLDLKARLHALALTMQKKQALAVENRKQHLK